MNRTFVCSFICLAILCGCSDSVSITSQSMAEHFDAYCVMTGGTLDESSDKTYIYGVCNCAGNPCIDSGCTADGLNCNTAERRLCKEGATRCVNVPDETGASIGHLQRCEDGQFRDHEECAQVSCHYGNNDQENGVCGECIDHKLQCSDDGIVNCENGKLAYMIEPCADKRGCILKNGIPQCASCDSSSGDYCANGYMNRCVDGRYVQERCPNGDCKGRTQCGDCHDGDFGCLAILDSDGMRWFYRSTCMGGEFKTIQESEKPLILTSVDSKFYGDETCSLCEKGSKRCIDYHSKSYLFSCQSDGSYRFEQLCDSGCDKDGSCGECTDGIKCDGSKLNVCEQGVLSTSSCKGGCENYLEQPICMTEATVNIDSMPLRRSPQWHFKDKNGDTTDNITNNEGKTQVGGEIDKKGTVVSVVGCTKANKSLDESSQYCFFRYGEEYFYTAHKNLKFSSDSDFNDLVNYNIYIPTVTPNYSNSLWNSDAYQEAVGNQSSSLVALIDILCVLKEGKTKYNHCTFYDSKGSVTNSFKKLIESVKEYNNKFNISEPSGLGNKVICPLLDEKYNLKCDYWHRDGSLYTSMICQNGECKPDTSSLDQTEIVDRMTDVLSKGGFIIAKLNKGKQDDYWKDKYRAFVIYGIDKNAEVLYIDDPADLHFSDTYESFFKRNVELFFVTKK